MSWVMVVWINLAFGEIRHVPQTQSHAPNRADRRDCHEFGRIRASAVAACAHFHPHSLPPRFPSPRRTLPPTDLASAAASPPMPMGYRPWVDLKAATWGAR